jgi:hypothetical protein
MHVIPRLAKRARDLAVAEEATESHFAIHESICLSCASLLA